MSQPYWLEVDYSWSEFIVNYSIHIWNSTGLFSWDFCTLLANFLVAVRPDKCFYVNSYGLKTLILKDFSWTIPILNPNPQSLIPIPNANPQSIIPIPNPWYKHRIPISNSNNNLQSPIQISNPNPQSYITVLVSCTTYKN